jgi:hypothetical protein
MSRAYRIKVRESLRRTLRADDHVGTQLEILDVLPPEETAALLRGELLRRGFQENGPRLVREQGGVTVAVDACTGEVTVRSGACAEADLETESEGYSFDQDGNHARQTHEALKKQARGYLEKQAGEQEAKLQRQVTDQLEGQLGDLRQELDQVVNRVTVEALKRKAAQLGHIKELTEDPQTGSMTIVLEV